MQLQFCGVFSLMMLALHFFQTAVLDDENIKKQKCMWDRMFVSKIVIVNSEHI